MTWEDWHGMIISEEGEAEGKVLHHVPGGLPFYLSLRLELGEKHKHKHNHPRS